MRIKVLDSRPAPATIRQLFRRLVRGQAPAIPVQRQQMPYWQERGWIRQGDTYSGRYQTRYGSFVGRAEEHRGGHIDFFLYNPSDEVRAHGHWVCFQHRGNDWYLVHMGREPRDVSSGILTVERLIAEAHGS